MTIIHLTESDFTERMVKRDILRAIIRGLSTGGHRGNGDARDFARKWGLKVKPVGGR
jgi:hypothetical protein